MKTARLVSHKDLPAADLVIDAVYDGSGTQLSGEPISKLLKAGNVGGFRVSGLGEKKNFIVLYTSGENKDWPDQLDVNTGQFTYYGDNRKPGRKLHATNGNKILERVFDSLHSNRSKIPPFFVFQEIPDSGQLPVGSVQGACGARLFGAAFDRRLGGCLENIG